MRYQIHRESWSSEKYIGKVMWALQEKSTEEWTATTQEGEFNWLTSTTVGNTRPRIKHVSDVKL